MFKSAAKIPPKKKIVILSIFLVFLIAAYLFCINLSKKNEVNLQPPIIPQDQELLKAAGAYVQKNSVPNLKFDLKILKRLDKWVLIEVIPAQKATDNAAVVLEKTNGQWIPRGFGTIFPELEKEIPELFH